MINASRQAISSQGNGPVCPEYFDLWSMLVARPSAAMVLAQLAQNILIYDQH